MRSTIDWKTGTPTRGGRYLVVVGDCIVTTKTSIGVELKVLS